MSEKEEKEYSAAYQALIESEEKARAKVLKLGYELIGRDDLTQKQLEDWDKFYHAEEAARGRSTDAGRFLRAAIRAKWFQNGLAPSIADVGKMKGWKVRALQDAINALYVLEVTPDPNF